MATEALPGHAICMHFKSHVSQMLKNIALNIRTKSAMHRLLPQVKKLL